MSADAAAIPNNLPLQLSSFVGREREIGEVRRLLGGARLLTLTGAGGCGKTRLALRVADEVRDGYAHGVWLVELAALADPGLIEQTIAVALGVREAPGATFWQTLLEYLRARDALLVLDNCEHLVAACAEVAERLLRGCPDLHILATSREALGIAGETAFRVPSLSVPGTEGPASAEAVARYESVRLFVERAQAASPEFRLREEDVGAVGQVCRRLDGIPLAIELAAARVKLLSVAQIAERLDDRFRLLTGGSRTALPRQQTLRALIDWSYDLLSTAEQALLRRLAVFAGGWTLEAAEAVCTGEAVGEGEVLDLLGRLVDKSLVLVEAPAGAVRHRLPETVRQYARDRLVEAGEVGPVRARHLDYFLEMAERLAPELEGRGLQAAMRRLESEHDNLRAALDWSLADAGRQVALRLTSSLFRFWVTPGYYTEGRQWAERVLAGLAPEASSAPEAVQPGEQTSLARVYWTAGTFAWMQGDLARAREMTEESLAICRRLDEKETLASVLLTFGLVLNSQGAYEQAVTAAEESVTLLRALNNKWLLAVALGTLGAIRHSRGDKVPAAALYEESLCLHREVGNTWYMAAMLSNLGHLALDGGDDRLATRRYEESLALSREIENRLHTAIGLSGLAGIALRAGHSMAAARLLGTSAAQSEAIGASTSLLHFTARRPDMEALRAALGEEALKRALEDGRRLSPEQIVAEVQRLASSLLSASPTAGDEGVGTPASSGSSFPAGLTLREVEVLRLVARGLTSAQIADQLVISAVTVNTHLRNIYGKIGVSSRAGAARFAVEHRLV
jgi:non-specific serine/threonine protein kinase